MWSFCKKPELPEPFTDWDIQWVQFGLKSYTWFQKHKQIAPLRANHIPRITSDFTMDLTNKEKTSLIMSDILIKCFQWYLIIHSPWMSNYTSIIQEQTTKYYIKSTCNVINR